jgi:hypothetical protein
MRHLRFIAAVFLLMAASANTVFCESNDAKLSPPGIKDSADATKLVREVYKDDLASAKKPEAMAALAKKLLQAGIDEQKDMSGRYALFMLAKETAIEGSDLDDAFNAVDEANKTYQIDGIKMKSDAALAAAKAVRSNEQRKAFVTQILSLVNQAVMTDRYDLARPLSDLALASARMLNDPALLKQTVAEVRQVADAESGYADVKKAKAVLDQKPTDPDANLKFGKFVCFFKSDWQAGLPMLALGNDAGLKSLAEKELTGTASADDQLMLGDGWWDVANKQKGNVRIRILRHAESWYAQSISTLQGLAKTRTENRMKEIVRIVEEAGLPKEKGTFPQTFDLADEKALQKFWKLSDSWQFTGGGLVLAHGQGVAWLESIDSFKGDLVLNFVWAKGKSDRGYGVGLDVHMFGETLGFGKDGVGHVSITRHGDTITVREDSKTIATVKIKEKNLGEASHIKIQGNRQGNYMDNPLSLRGIQIESGTLVEPSK